MSTAQEAAEMLKEWFPDATPEEIFQEWQEINLELIERGDLAALKQSNGDILFKHTEHCTDDELSRAMTTEQYKLWMHR